MSENARESRSQFGFLSAVGLFSLAVLAVLVALYFYNADIRQAGDGAIDHARAYKQTIVADYSRFYECMRGGVPASPQPVKAEGAPGAPRAASVPVVVYPPYADYPTYPAYQDGTAGGRADAPAGAMQPSISGEYGTAGPTSRPEEYPRAGAGSPPGAAAMPGREGQPGFAMQAGPMIPGGPAMQAEHQGGPAIQPGPSMEPGPIMQGTPTMQAGPMMQPGPGTQPEPAIQAGPGMPPGPMMQPEPTMQAYQGRQPGYGMHPRAMAQGYPPPAAWQGRGMSPSGMPPSGMTAPMPYGQGQSGGLPPPGQGPGTATGPNYVMPPGGPDRYGPQGSMPPPPWSRYGYGMAGSAPGGGSDPGVVAVIPATPTMPITSMMPPPGDAAPVLPGEAGQVDPQIAAARQAAANQQHQDAIRIYRGYISRNASDPSAFGELGNVLLSAGRPQEAAQAYYEASSRLIDVGQPGTVYLLLPHIEQHDPLLGAVLMRRLASLPRSIY